MNKKDLNNFKTLFSEMKQKIIRSISNKDLEADVDGDEVDEVQARTITDVAEKLSKREIQKLDKINVALKKIEDGSFGECESCGEDIGKKRLEALPGVEFCIACAEEQESQVKNYSEI